MVQEMAKHSLWRKKHDQRKSDHNDLLSALKTLWLSAGRTVVKTLKTAVATWSSTLTVCKGAHRCTHPNVPHQIVTLNGPWSVSCVWTLPVIRLGAQRCWKGTRRKPQRTVADRSRHQMASWWDPKAWRTENGKAANESHIVSPFLHPFPVVRSCLLASSSFSWQFHGNLAHFERLMLRQLNAVSSSQKAKSFGGSMQRSRIASTQPGTPRSVWLWGLTMWVCLKMLG